MKKIIISCILLLVNASCQKENIKEIKEDHFLIIILIDIGKSFNIIDGDSNNNYLNESCTEIADMIHNLKVSEDCMIIRAIKKESFRDDSFICKIDLTKEFDTVGNPTALLLDYWKSLRLTGKRKRTQDKRVEIEKDKAIRSLALFKNKHLGRGERYSDILGALQAAKINLEERQFQDYKKMIIVYSNFKHPNNQESTIIDLGDAEVDGRYVSKNSYRNYEEYDANFRFWHSSLKCKRLTFKSPEESMEDSTP